MKLGHSPENHYVGNEKMQRMEVVQETGRRCRNIDCSNAWDKDNLRWIQGHTQHECKETLNMDTRTHPAWIAKDILSMDTRTHSAWMQEHP